VRLPGRILTTAAVLTIVLPAAAARADGLYVALGDSTTVGYGGTEKARDGFVTVFGAWLARPENGGIDDVRNRATFGASSESARGDQVPEAVADIDEPSDAKVVTVALGINDRWFECPYGFNLATCPLASDLTSILQDLQAALARDPGPERLLVLEYFNPIVGGDPNDVRWWDDRLLGTDRAVDCSGKGDALAFNDITACVAQREGATPVDPYPLFKAHGDEWLDGHTHPNDAGHRALAALLEDPSSSGTTPPGAFIAPNVATGDSSELGARAATVTGAVNPDGVPSAWRAQYGVTTAYGARTAWHDLQDASTELNIGDRLHRLQPATTYHYRLVAINRFGTSYGADRTFTTARGRWRRPHGVN
jgi:lysophospholipase L1-like esterase